MIRAPGSLEGKCALQFGHIVTFPQNSLFCYPFHVLLGTSSVDVSKINPLPVDVDASDNTTKVSVPVQTFEFVQI